MSLTTCKLIYNLDRTVRPSLVRSQQEGRKKEIDIQGCSLVFLCAGDCMTERALVLDWLPLSRSVDLSRLI